MIKTSLFTKISLFIVTLALIGCSSDGAIKNASIKSPANLQQQKVVKLKVNGNFGVFSKSGDFTFDDNYSGSFDKSSSDLSILGIIDTDKNTLAATVKNKNNIIYKINCSGGGTSLNLGDFSFGGNDGFSCSITSNGKNVGSYKLTVDSSLFASEQKVHGVIKLNNLTYTLQSIHEVEGSAISFDEALGYYVNSGVETIAVIQTNGLISLQHMPINSNIEKDALVVTMIASALRSK